MNERHMNRIARVMARRNSGPESPIACPNPAKPGVRLAPLPAGLKNPSTAAK
jgi:hypothetical protein